ncbi:unnamed protein product [Diplocarpon coronariae]|uniref:NIF3 NGG1 interacting factor 3-like n=1 Tax=Diplocarpon coronariae TaxID=2795749 RepID=A0A218ZAS9_9HELO|nr:NIF3 NGG1 interacting factor 3-like [Marssonina coronariae]
MSSPRTTSSPFTKVVVAAMRQLYPEKLADSSFDNTGLLLEAPHRPGHLNNSALLTIDLTKAVADEAIARKDSIIISYHPIIFRGLKSLTLDNTQQTSLLRLAQEGISVYSPHTALDAAPDGLNSWLVSVVIGKFSPETCIVRYNSKTIHPIKDLSTLPEQFSEAGYGQIVTFSSSQSLGSIIRRIMKALDVRNLSVAVPQNVPRGNRSSIRIKSIGICAGSGGSMLNGLDVDLLFTGELSHHEALAAIEAGRCVITAFHSNSERGFLKHMKQDLENAVAKELNQPADLEDNDAKRFNIDISKIDSDPFDMITDIDKF